MRKTTYFYDLPLIGSVAAGSPILAQQNIQKKIMVNSSMFEIKPDYLLKVTGDSMVNAGILDGDLVAIQKTDHARNGQIVVARVNESDVTLKRYKKIGSMVWLMPENDSMTPIKVDLEYDVLHIEGVYLGLIRPLAISNFSVA